MVALTQLGILYIIALFVERALEVLMKAWRQDGKIRLEKRLASPEERDRADADAALEEYRAGRKRANQTGPTRASG